jgi:enoyl-CoA hydratase/carnithine racemase
MSDILTERQGDVLRLTIDRAARRNAITGEVLAGIDAAFAATAADNSIRAIVLTGAGDKAFCAGADLTGDAFKMDPSLTYQRLADLMRAAQRVNVPIIARVNGACVAGGMGLLALADLAVAHPRAVFGLPEVKVGVFPAQVLVLLKDLLPRRLLSELVITGATIDAAAAHAAGLINHVTEDLDGRVTEWLDQITRNSPAAIRRSLYTLKRIGDMPFEAAAAFAESQIVLTAATEDAREGTAAFREKRPPKWTGR